MSNLSNGMFYDPDPMTVNLTAASITAASQYGSNAIPNGGYITTSLGTPYSNDTITLSDSSLWGRTALSADASGTLQLEGKNADIKINGKSLTDVISKLEERLNILVPNPELEAEWDELRELGERYRQLEREFDEKSRAWAALKKE